MAYNVGGFAGGYTPGSDPDDEDDFDEFEEDEDDFDTWGDDDEDDFDDEWDEDYVADWKVTAGDLLDTLSTLPDDTEIPMRDRFACLGQITLKRLTATQTRNHEWGIGEGYFRDLNGNVALVYGDYVTGRFVSEVVRGSASGVYTVAELRARLTQMIAEHEADNAAMRGEAGTD